MSNKDFEEDRPPLLSYLFLLEVIKKKVGKQKPFYHNIVNNSFFKLLDFSQNTGFLYSLHGAILI